MGTKKLQIEISDTLYDRLYRVVTDKKGRWRGSKQPAYKAIQTAVEAALQEFLNSLESKNDDNSS